MKWFFDMLNNERGETGPKKVVEPNPDDPIEDDEEIEDDPGLDYEIEDDLDDEGELEIDLDDPPKKHPAEIRLDKEKRELKETNATLQRQIDELNQKVSSPAQAAPAPIAGDPNDPMNWTEQQWDEVAKKDWKKAVDLRSEIQARKQYHQQSTVQEFNRVLEDSKQSVLRRHPELSDMNSEKSRVYKNIVTASPEYVTMKEGPLFAMYKMEEFMEKNMGYKRDEIVKAETRARENEQGRLNRVQLTSTTGRNVSEGNKVVLTKDEVDFCELQGINPKTYATNKKKLASSGRGGIQL